MEKATVLKFYILDGILEGTVNGEPISIKASSGGGANSKWWWKIKNKWEINNPELVSKKQGYTPGNIFEANETNRGGPIPPGKYTIGKAVNVRFWKSSLTPDTGTQKAYDRHDLLIHGSGKFGSDGCIVPDNDAEWQVLRDLLKKIDSGTLWVFEEKYFKG